jgi:hypothetical protein
MRQFFSPRFWLTLGALGLLLAGLQFTVSRLPETAAEDGPVADEIRRIDLVSPVFSVEAQPGFRLNALGRTTAEMRLFLDGIRVAVIKPGTYGEIRCAELAELGKCLVLADLLGDAVVWFALIPSEQKRTVTLPAVRSIGDDGFVQLDNGWELPHAPRVERRCPEDTSSLNDFIRRFGDVSTSTFDMQTQQIIRVTCILPS